ncbi:Heterokaryon incompatibility protein 6, OR allele [Pseudocercospora fuligena]|uniref:Heterokaryon incompatibility protein 6, OR allele n=1 Tax=Pseudocercospora fuligena TaxID=685502 RepID=A0A8H6RG01_9PEZI|nr:Heterokaryon incompatibility protein 6, OR allele [Pseudocercospora fuligena]
MAFQYPSLREDCIRLLQLLPLGPEGQPQLKLINNVTISQKGLKYTALSYCWGDSNDTLPALVDGMIFNITRNLHQALVSIVSHHQSITGTFVWIDAICINQENAEEKSRQVSQMWRIFGSARRVLAWLGPEDETSEAMFEALNQVRRHMRRAQNRLVPSAAGARISRNKSRRVDISKCIKTC